MRADQAKTIPVDSYLESQGVTPRNARKGGRELWYISPIRSTDKNPSFKVDTILNCWYDYGVDLGGNTLDLAIKMLNDSTVSQALHHLDRTGLYSPYRNHSPARPLKRSSTLGTTKNSKTAPKTKRENQALELLKSQDLTHPALLQYLEQRGIDLDTAHAYASQIDFKHPLSGSTYFALGFPSGDGYEARNALFKGFVGMKKDITVLQHPDSSLLLVFEGFMDFLTYLTIKKLKAHPATTIILNSGNMKARALPYLQDIRFSKIQLFLDNDPVGESTVSFFSNAVEGDHLEDMRGHYPNCSDLNEWHLKRIS